MEIVDFVRESNLIEGIHREPLPAEIEAHVSFLSAPNVTIDALVDFVNVVQPDA